MDWGETGKKKHGRPRRFLKALGAAAVVLLMGGAGALCYLHFAPPARTCLRCHEIQPAYDAWKISAHRNVLCKDCHGGSLTSGLQGLRESATRVIRHFARKEQDNIGLREEQVVRMTDACRACHEGEYAKWLASGHSATYAAIFLNEQHNRTEQPIEDCLRCHGMFFEGTIAGVVAPLSTKGPWRLVKAGLANVPTIPCLACHQLHVKGEPGARPDYSDPKTIAAQRTTSETAHVDFYDRSEKLYFAAADLPLPHVRLDAKPIAVSPDPRQRVCTQCHAPNSWLEAGTSDDRTPRGVHAGLSCAACHEPHSNDARASCANCHPALSNCGLDVGKMDTTHLSPTSKHNVHFVACGDCHPNGIPTKAKP